MKTNLSLFINPGDTVAVALSGGSDSMALLHYMLDNAKIFNFRVLALNVEHGIRGESSKRDTDFVKDFCAKDGVELLCYSVDCIEKSKSEKLSIEQAARQLRYECFFHALNSGKCNKIATAHHRSDNVESVLFNLFRGTGIKGIAGIHPNFENKIIRPFLSVSKEEISQYISENNIPFVTDETNFSDDYTRNNLRLNVIPSIKKVFPEMEKSISRFAEIARLDDDFLQSVANTAVNFDGKIVTVKLPQHKAVMSRAVIIALKHLGIERDWEKAHVDSIIQLCDKETAAKISLPKGIVSVREYDKIIFYKETCQSTEEITFSTGILNIGGCSIHAKECQAHGVDLKSGLFGDKNKIPRGALIRFKKEGDVFKKFGGGTKSLGDYFTDKKIPVRERDKIPLLAFKNEVLVIFGIAVSDSLKADENTKTLIQFIKE